MKPIKTMSSIALLCISCLSICCKEEKREQSGKFLQIDIPLQADETHLPADSLFCGKEILALETTPDNLISKVDKLEMTNDRLYLLDEQQDMIFIFDRKGKYITKIADIGRGPAEYIEISDFHIDNDVLYLCTGGNGGKIICYDLDGKYQKSFRTEYSCNRITTDSNSIYVHHNFSHPNGNNVGVYDKKENKLVKCYKPYPKQQEGIGSSNRCWTSCNNKVYAAFDYEYSIYTLQPDTCQIVAQIDFGKNHMFPPEYKDYSFFQHQNYINQTGGIFKSPVVQFCNTLFVTPKRTIFNFIYTCYNHICIIDHQTHTMKFGIPWPDEYYWNIHGLDPIYASDEYLVSTKSSSGIINYRNIHGKVAFTEKEWALDITEESNPCLYFYKLK